MTTAEMINNLKRFSKAMDIMNWNLYKSNSKIIIKPEETSMRAAIEFLKERIWRGKGQLEALKPSEQRSAVSEEVESCELAVRILEIYGSKLEALVNERRERIATAALQGMLADLSATNNYVEQTPNLVARGSVLFADALIAELDKHNPEKVSNETSFAYGHKEGRNKGIREALKVISNRLDQNIISNSRSSIVDIYHKIQCLFDEPERKEKP